MSFLNKNTLFPLLFVFLSAPSFASDQTTDIKPQKLLTKGVETLLDESYEFTMSSRLKKSTFVSPDSGTATHTNIKPESTDGDWARWLNNAMMSYANILGDSTYVVDGALNNKTKQLSLEYKMKTKSNNFESYFYFPVLLDYKDYKATLNINDFNPFIFAKKEIETKAHKDKFVRFSVDEKDKNKLNQLRQEVFNIMDGTMSDVFDSFSDQQILLSKANHQEQKSGAQNKITINASPNDWQRAIFFASVVAQEKKRQADHEKNTTHDNEAALDEPPYTPKTKEEINHKVDELMKGNANLWALLFGHSSADTEPSALHEYLNKAQPTYFYLDTQERIVLIEIPHQTVPLNIFNYGLPTANTLTSDSTIKIKYLRSPKLPFNPKERDIVDYVKSPQPKIDNDTLVDDDDKNQDTVTESIDAIDLEEPDTF